MVSSRVFGTSLWSFFVISTLHTLTIVHAQRGRVPHYELPPSDRPEVYKPPTNQDPNLEWTFVENGGSQQPFMGGSGDDIEFLEPLLVKLATAMDPIESHVNSQLRANSPVDYGTITVASDDADNACSIYTYYQSRCKVDTARIDTTYSVLLKDTFGTLDASDVSSKATDLFLSCACYSSTWYVPNFYDNALWACLQISYNNSNFGPWTTSEDGSLDYPCQYNVRLAETATGLGPTTTTAAAGSTASTAQPGTSGSATASPTSTSGARRLVATSIVRVDELNWIVFISACLLATIFV